MGRAARTGRPRRYCSRSCQCRAYRRRRDRGRLDPATPRTTGHQATAELVQTAIAVADSEGITAITLQVLAARAGVSPAQVRSAVTSRDNLVALMVQRLFAHRPAVAQGRSSVETLTGLAEQEWTLYREHPWLVGVVASSRPPLVPAVLDTAGVLIAAFSALGLDPMTAYSRYLALSAYVQGMAMLLLAEQQESARSGISYAAWWSAEMRALARTGAYLRHPWMNEIGEVPGAAALDGWFRAGLERVLAGLTDIPA